MHCPFSTPDYLAGLSNIGIVETHTERPVSVLKRRIPDTDLFDGVGAWPYRWITNDGVIEDLITGFRHLLTLSVVTHPGWVSSPALAATAEFRLLKQHYMFDPAKPRPSLSRRSHRRVMDADKRGHFSDVSLVRERLKIIALYQALKDRRGLSGGLFDMPPSHFEAIARLPNAAFFEVSDSEDIGAMACGVIIDDLLQILHLVTTEHGLKWNASYLMMHGLQEYVKDHGLRLLTGGMPMAGSNGLAAFKAKWTNTFLPVHLLCIVNDHASTEKLKSKNIASLEYFPPYRNPR